MDKNRFNKLFWGLLFISINVNIFGIDVLDIIGYMMLFSFFSDGLKNDKKKLIISIVLNISILFELVEEILKFSGKEINLDMFTATIPTFIFNQVGFLLYVIVIYFICKYLYSFCAETENEEGKKFKKKINNLFIVFLALSGIYQVIMPMTLNFKQDIESYIYIVCIVRFLIIISLLVTVRKLSKIDVNIRISSSKKISMNKKSKVVMIIILCLAIGSWIYNGIRLYRYSLDEGFFIKQDITIPVTINTVDGVEDLGYGMNYLEIYYVENCRNKVPGSIDVEFKEIESSPLVALENSSGYGEFFNEKTIDSSELIVPYKVKTYYINLYSLPSYSKEKLIERLKKDGKVEITKMKVLDESSEQIDIGNMTLKLKENMAENEEMVVGIYNDDGDDQWSSPIYYYDEDIVIEGMEIEKNIDKQFNVVLNDTLVEDLKFPMEIKKNSGITFGCKEKATLPMEDKLKIIQGNIKLRIKNHKGENGELKWKIDKWIKDVYNKISQIGNISDESRTQ